MIIEVIQFTLRDGVDESELLKAIKASYVELYDFDDHCPYSLVRLGVVGGI